MKEYNVESFPPTSPSPHRAFLVNAVEILAQEAWLVGICAAGSYATDSMDEFSDLDLVLAVEDAEHPGVTKRLMSIVASFGPLLTAFTSEHVGQPRLVQCLYGPPLLHVDVIFDPISEIANRTGPLCVVWERDGRVSPLISGGEAYAEPNAQWIEDRFWVWVHKAIGKVGRGELLEAIEYLAFLRSRVLGPLGLHAAGRMPTGVRRIELDEPALAVELHATVATCDADECLAALRACVDLYRRLRVDEGPALQYRRDAERAVTAYLSEVDRAKGGPAT